ncbi:MAG: hypothetical protein FJ098_12790 [Deltaproteobacteria bacterium]|nr:hypothetical protein [Deltaproteobacteria bacterium]
MTASDEDPVQRTRGLVGWAEVEEAALGEIDETGRTDEESCRETRDTVFFAAGGPTMCSDEDEPGGGPACGWYYVILAVGDDPGGCQMMCGAGTLRSALWRVTEGSWDLLGSWEDAWILPLLVGDLDRDQDPELLARTEFGEWSYSLFDIELDPPSVSELPVWEVGAGCVDCWCLDFDVQVMDANPGGL